ncbi:hypothetical protein BDP27DRAFT_1413958 [Rhodocollybia butyracea]|uniref:Uncharacterized protein n=1 Tax=Rhodocollybia butyracea TaxID=206335 RepID=A0A9P5QAI1_9AGAR|nr:hypothetical protein BDP27DRAFT_1413958 [Rhodocollybia butyracea]
MRFVTAIVAVALAGSVLARSPPVPKPKPSSTAPYGYSCPPTANTGMSMIEWLSDLGHHPTSQPSFGCTYYGHTSSTSHLKCVYSVLTGDCTSAEEECPKKATPPSSQRKRSPEPAPAVPGSTYYLNRL